MASRRVYHLAKHLKNARLSLSFEAAEVFPFLLPAASSKNLTQVALENREVGTLDGGRVGAISGVDSSRLPSLRAQSAAPLN